MIQTLKIQNVALIDSAILDFGNGLNVISGETGAGKSILLDSLSFVFGGRADKSLIRTGSKSMKVEIIFNGICEKQIKFIKEEFGIDCDAELFLSRELDLNGKNTCKINGELVPVAVVKRICGMLVDLHGQSEHLAILNNDYQLEIVDLFSKSANSVLEELNMEIDELKQIEKDINALGGSETEKQNLIDLYSYQINEIENANIYENEFEELSAQKKEMQQYEKINENLKTAYENISKNSYGESGLEKINTAIKSIQNIMQTNIQYEELFNRLKSVQLELDDINETILDCINNNVFDEERFSIIDNRIDYIKTLFRKYGGSYESYNKYYLDIKNKLDNLINGQERYIELTNKKSKKLEKIIKIQENLTKIRKNSANILKVELEKELKTLGMGNAKFDIAFSKIAEDYSTAGVDRVEFMFSSNLGFELKPLNKVVSGGEMSRVMLAYKIVVSSVDDIHTIIFDEIDSGLSGNIAMVVAEYMARLSLKKQIIAVSHLPQICAMADINIKVEKYSDKTTTHSKSTILENENLYSEIGRLMGVASNGFEESKILKEKCNEYKNKLKTDL